MSDSGIAHDELLNQHRFNSMPHSREPDEDYYEYSSHIRPQTSLG